MIRDGDLLVSLEDRQEPIDLYDGELVSVDRKIGQPMSFLRQNGLYENTLTILIADHGEAMFEHGFWTHGGDHLYNELVRVPLIVKMPGSEHAGRRVGAPVELIDIMPTILDYFGIRQPDQVSGQSLMALIRNGEYVAGPVFTQTKNSVAVLVDGYKYVFTDEPRRVEVFNYSKDLADARNIANRMQPELIANAWSLIEQWRAVNAEFAAEYTLEEEVLDDNQIEALRALGYIN